MPIADGLKEVLVNCGLTRKQILTYTTEESATMLDIDKYVASIIRNAAKELLYPFKSFSLAIAERYHIIFSVIVKIIF